MLNINKKLDGTTLNVILAGRMDAESALEFNEAVVQNLEGIEVLRLDARDLEYIASAGLRELLKCAKEVDDFAVVNASDAVKQVFSMTDFDKLIPCS